MVCGLWISRAVRTQEWFWTKSTAKSKSFRRNAQFQPLQRAELLVYQTDHWKTYLVLEISIPLISDDCGWGFLPAFNRQGSRLSIQWWPHHRCRRVDELARSFWPSRCRCGVMQGTRGSAGFQGSLGAKQQLKTQVLIMGFDPNGQQPNGLRINPSNNLCWIGAIRKSTESYKIVCR